MLNRDEELKVEKLYEQVTLHHFKNMSPDVTYGYFQWFAEKLKEVNEELKDLSLKYDQLDQLLAKAYLKTLILKKNLKEEDNDSRNCRLS